MGLLTSPRQNIFKAYVESGVRMGCESQSGLSNYVLWLSVLVVLGIFDLTERSAIASIAKIGSPTSIFTTCPSPLVPPMVAVTTTKVSLDTKFRMHRWYLPLLPEWACRSNFSEQATDSNANQESSATKDVRGNEGSMVAVVCLQLAKGAPARSFWLQETRLA